MNAIPCTVCGEEDHRAHRCPNLCSPLNSGFYAPPAGARQGGDDDDESHKIEKPIHPVFGIVLLTCLKLNFKLVKL